MAALGVLRELDGVVGAGDGGVEPARQGVDPAELRLLRRRASGPDDDRLMIFNHLGRHRETAQAIGEDPGRGV